MKERKSIEYEKTDLATRSRALQVGVRPRKRTESKKMLITGTGRSGTMYMSKLLQKSGIDMPHEILGKDGSVSWYFCVDSDWYPYHPWRPRIHPLERKSDVAFEHSLHQVRYPLLTIASASVVHSEIDIAFCRDNGFIPDEPTILKDSVLRSMHMWHNINKLANKECERTYQLENIAKEYGKITKLIVGEALPIPELAKVNRGTGWNTPIKLTWKELIDKDATLTKKIQALARKFKYKV